MTAWTRSRKLQLLEEVLDVGAHGRLLDEQAGGDLGVGPACGDLLEHLAVAYRERGEFG